jgi:hypothetical protein
MATATVAASQIEMNPVSADDLKDIIRHIAVRRRKPIFVWGKPGIGKSQIVAQVAAEFGCDESNNQFVDIRLGQYDSVDLRGIPVPHDDGTTVWNMPATLPFKGNKKFNAKAKYIFIFFDEMNGAEKNVLGVTYQILQDRRVGEHVLMDNVVIICAGNRETDRGVTSRMPTPVANRLKHFELIEDPDAVCYHFQEIGLPAVGIAFLQFRKNLLSTFNPASPNKAFATPRSWESALQDFADEKMPDKIKRQSIVGTIGKGAALEFFGFVEIWHKVIPVSKIVKDPMGVELPKEESMRYATAVNISGSLDLKNCGPLHKFLSRMEPTYCILAWHLAVKRDKALFATNEYLKMANEYKEVFAA